MHPYLDLTTKLGNRYFSDIHRVKEPFCQTLQCKQNVHPGTRSTIESIQCLLPFLADNQFILSLQANRQG
jgi:hypothetical protein